MAEINEAQLKAQIKSGDFKTAYFIYGEESYLKEHYVSLLKNKLIDPTFEAFNYHFFEGRDADIDDVLKDAQMIPMMGEYNLVIVRDYKFANANEVKLVEEYLADPPLSTVLVLWYDSIEPDVKKDAKIKKIVKAFSSAGDCVNMARRTQNDLIKLIVKGAQKRGSSISNGNAAYLITVVGSDMKLLLNELDKLALFAQAGEIDRKIIDNMATKSLQARIFDLSKYVVAGNSDKAYEVINALFAMQEEPVPILNALGSYYVDMYRVKCAKTAGFTYGEVDKYYRYGNARQFVLRNANRDCAALTEKQLRDSIDAVSDTDIKIKSTAVDKRLLIEELVAKLLVIAKGAAYA